MKKKDIFLAGGILLLAGLLALGMYGRKPKNGNTLKITVDGEVYGTYALQKDQTIEIKTDHGTNRLVILNGSAHMEEADCPDGYCKKQGSIQNINETIVCLPHKLVAEVENDNVTPGSKEDAPDVVAK